MMGKGTKMGRFLMIPLLAMAVFCAAISSSWGAEWDFGAKLGYESNVNRSLDDEKADTIFSAYAAYDRSPSGETRLDWTLRSTLSGSAYATEEDFNSVMAAVAPGISLFLNPIWRLNVSPFLRGKAVDDSEQSAIAWGLRATLTQKWQTRFYTGQFYNYTDSNADEDVYSYSENAVGVFVGVNWTPKFFTEIGYEYAHGDSFVSFRDSPKKGSGSGQGQGQGQGQGPGQSQGQGQGQGPGQSQGQGPGQSQGQGQGQGQSYGYPSAFNALVIKDTVDRNSFGINAGYRLNQSLVAVFEYTYMNESGSIGSVDNHSAFIGLECRF